MTNIAMAASARDWPDRLHRHVLDHGGARVVGRLMGPTQVIESSFDVLFIDDVCSFLTPGLVSAVRASGREVIGVFAPDDGPDGKRRLLECGISDVIECEASAVELVDKATASVAPLSESAPPLPPPTRKALSIGVVGVVDGVGATEVAISLARGVSERRDAILVDLDPVWPSVAQRLDVPPHPNLRTLVDVAVHERGDVTETIHRRGALGVIVGATSASQIPNHELRLALDALVDTSMVMITDLGSIDRSQPLMLRGCDSVILVGTGDPVGVSRTVRATARLRETVEEAQVLVAINKVPPRRFHRAEVRDELEGWGVPVTLLPFDPAIPRAAWEGTLVDRGPFIKVIRRIAGLIGETRP